MSRCVACDSLGGNPNCGCRAPIQSGTDAGPAKPRLGVEAVDGRLVRRVLLRAVRGRGRKLLRPVLTAAYPAPELLGHVQRLHSSDLPD